MEGTTVTRRDEIRARLDAATPAPWLPESGVCPHCAADDCWQPAPPGMRSGKGYCEATGLAVYSGPESDADDDLVAHAPADLRDLLAVAEAAREVGPPECDLCYEEDCTGNDEGRCPCDDVCHPWQMSARMDLRAALTRLDAATGGEQ